MHSLHGLWTCLHWPFCPGVFIAILGFMAAAVTFREKPGPREKAVWIFVFLLLMCGEVWMMGLDRDKHDADEKQARGDAVQQAAVNAFLVGQIVDARNRLSSLDKKIDDAKGNPQLIATLESQASQERAQKDAATHQLLVANAGSKQVLLTLLSGVVQEMEDWHQKWLADDRAISEQIRIYGTDTAYFKAKGIDPSAKISELQIKRSDQDAEYSKQVKSPLANANYLRQQLLQDSKTTDDDQAIAAIFTKSSEGQTINYVQMSYVTTYMEKLAQKFASVPARAINF
jgi:hypothetical protein